MTLILETTNRRRAQEEGWADWIRSPADERSVDAGCVFDLASADRVYQFFERFLRHSKGEWGGKRFTLLDWQKQEIIGPLFGWKRPDGLRRYRRGHVEIAKKNGKSTLGAGIGLYMLIGDGEPGAEVYSAATKREQASIVHGEAINMVKASPDLTKRLRINMTSGTIFHETAYSKYAVLASDAGGNEGLNIHCLIADELHVWKGRAFWDSLRYGFVARSQPILFVITTAGILDRSSLGWQEHEYAQAVLEDKVHDDDMLVFIRAADKDDDPLDPETHRKANPSYEVMIKPDDIMKDAQVAHQKRSEFGPFLRYRLNIWTQTSESFFKMEAWRACAGVVDEAAMVGRECWAGLDLSSREDLSAWVLLFPPTDDDPLYRVLARVFVPRETAEIRESEQGTPYATWGRDGYLIMAGEQRVDYSIIRQTIADDCRKFHVVTCGADPWNLEAMRQQLLDDIPELEIEEFPQQIKFMTQPVKELESLLVKKAIAHGGHPVLEWCAGNCVPDEDGNANVKLSKKKSKGKIDPIVALVMALGGYMVREETFAPGVYEL